jgi:hypothetical protein
MPLPLLPLPSSSESESVLAVANGTVASLQDRGISTVAEWNLEYLQRAFYWLYDSMTSALWYLTALLALSGSGGGNAGIGVASAQTQYLLGLGTGDITG